jgi:hypothetical protein
MNNEQQPTVTRAPRFIESLGTIPEGLPSVYEFIDESFPGTQNLVQGPLVRNFKNHPDAWNDSLDDASPSSLYVENIAEIFQKAYAEDQAEHNTDWVAVYKNLMILSCYGWIREHLTTVQTNDISEFTILTFAGALRTHLIEAEQNPWGVEWLRSRRPIRETGGIPSQEGRELKDIMGDKDHNGYLEQYKNGDMSGEKFFLTVAGDFLINHIRLVTQPEVYEKWQKLADEFADRPNPKTDPLMEVYRD